MNPIHFQPSWSRNGGFPEFAFRIRSRVDFFKVYVPGRGIAEVAGLLRAADLPLSRYICSIPRSWNGRDFGCIVTIHDPDASEIWALESLWDAIELSGGPAPQIEEMEVALDFRSNGGEDELVELLAWQRFHLNPYNQKLSFFRQRASRSVGKVSYPIEPAKEGSWEDLELGSLPDASATFYMGPHKASREQRVGFIRSYLKKTEYRNRKLVDLPRAKWAARLEACLQTQALRQAGILRPTDVRKGVIRKAVKQFLTMSQPSEPAFFTRREKFFEAAIVANRKRWQEVLPYGAAAIRLLCLGSKARTPPFKDANERIGHALSNLERRFA